MPAHWIGVDLGGTKILTGLFDDSLTLLARSKIATGAADGPDAVLGRVVESVREVLAAANIDPASVHGLGFGIPGQIVPNSTVVRFAPNLDWTDLDIAPKLPADWHWSIAVDNDVRMGTFGEFSKGAAVGAQHVLGVFVGTGVGGGMILNGELFAGAFGHAGEIGHTPVHFRRGSTLEQVAGRKYQMLRAKKLLADSPKRVRKEWKNVDLNKVKSSQLADFYLKGDPVAVRLVDDAARALGASIGGMANFLSPEVIVLGGGVTEALGESFRERIWEFAGRYMLPGVAERTKFVLAALGDDSGIVGAAAFAKSKFSQ
jgi:glucokinase